MIRAVALGLTLVVTILLTGCGLVVTDEAPIGVVQASAPTLLPSFSEIDALVPAKAHALKAAKARKIARRAALEIRIPSCDDDPLGRGFALDAHTIVAHRDAIPGGGWARLGTTNGRSTAVGASSAYRLGELGVIRVTRAVPRRLAVNPNVSAGTSVVVVTERNGKLRMLPGVVVDSVPGAPFGTRTKVLRLTAAVHDDDAGPVLDAKGRVVGAVFGIDEGTGLGVAVPLGALRGRSVARVLEAQDACDD